MENPEIAQMKDKVCEDFPGQVLTPAAEPGTTYLGTGRIIPVNQLQLQTPH
jgi:hypothetical protein